MIRGYAALFNVLTRPGNRAEPLIVRPGAFLLSGLCGVAASLHVDHMGRDYARTKDRSLRMWQDSVGLAFEADIPNTHAGLSLARGIAAGRHDQASLGYRERKSTMQRIGSEMVEVITCASFAEISITMEGGCPGTAVWLAGADIEDLPPHAKRLASHWGVGRMKALLPLARAA